MPRPSRKQQSNTIIAKVPSYKLSRQAARRRYDSQPWECYESPVSFASLKTPSQTAWLYVGNRQAPKKFRKFKASYVLSTVEPDGGFELSNDTVDHFEDNDDMDNAKQCILSGARKVDAAIREGKRVLVHCAAGMNRSASICVAYLITYCGWTPGKAIAHVRHRVEVCREVLDVISNSHFECILKCLKPGDA